MMVKEYNPDTQEELMAFIKGLPRGEILTLKFKGKFIANLKKLK